MCELFHFFYLEGWKQINSVVVTTAFWNATWPKKELMLFDWQICTSRSFHILNNYLQKLALYLSILSWIRSFYSPMLFVENSSDFHFVKEYKKPPNPKKLPSHQHEPFTYPRLHYSCKKSRVKQHSLFNSPVCSACSWFFLLVLPGNMEFTECLLTYKCHCTPDSKEVIYDQNI